MRPEFTSIDPLSLPAGPRYDLLTAAVQPRPIALVSTLGATGTANLAPFSFFMAGGIAPVSLMVSATLGTGGARKDSLRNIEETREFVVNLVNREMAQGMNEVSWGYPSEFDEWTVSGFHPLASVVIAPPRVGESPIQFECRLHEVVTHGQEIGSANYIIGEVVQIHVRADLWDGSALRADAFRPIARLGGAEYLDTSRLEIFTVPRPSGPTEPSETT